MATFKTPPLAHKPQPSHVLPFHRSLNHRGSEGQFTTAQPMNGPRTKSLTVSWDPSPTGTAVGYRVYVRMMSPTPMHYIFDAGAETKLNADLPIGENYYFTVVAYNGAGQSPPSSTFEFALF